MTKKLYFADYALIVFLVTALGLDFAYPRLRPFLMAAAALGALPTAWHAWLSLKRIKINIDVFNAVALVISFAALEIRSAAFIALMLAFARLLDLYTKTHATNAIKELLRLKPQTAFREKNGHEEEVPVGQVKAGDILVVRNGGRIPVDGAVVFGQALINESAVTGESMLVEKVIGDAVFSSTLDESGVIKIRATKVGRESTIERMMILMQEAAKHKSHSEKLADRFAEIFLPVVALIASATYFFTKDASMTAAIFLVACADDMAVAIPLAMTAALGNAARKGVIVKGGEYLNVLGKIKTLVFDKTGTLTYGEIAVSDFQIERNIRQEKFWKMVAVGEKFSEHPIGRAVFREALRRSADAPDADEFRVYKGSGVWARLGRDEVAIGDEGIFSDIGVYLPPNVKSALDERKKNRKTVFAVILNKKFAGYIAVADVLRTEARQSIEKLSGLGVSRILMFTGDNKEVAANISGALGIKDFHAEMRPEDKLTEIERLEKSGLLAMVGDGINDAPALARADVGIAMGREGAAVAVEAADVVILTDNLERLPDMVILARRTASVVREDMFIWGFSNFFGFFLVFTGFAGPALAAFYNFATDFLPLLNSARLFRAK